MENGSDKLINGITNKANKKMVRKLLKYDIVLQNKQVSIWKKRENCNRN